MIPNSWIVRFVYLKHVRKKVGKEFGQCTSFESTGPTHKIYYEKEMGLYAAQINQGAI